MSDDKPKPGAPSSSSIPPELKPFMGQREWPVAERRDEADVEAAFGPIEAMVAEWQRDADARDAGRGVGNVSAYVGPTAVPAGTPGATKEEPKVALAFEEVPRKLPAGNPALPTEEIDTRALLGVRAPGDDDVTLARGAQAPAKAGATSAEQAPPARTLGGNTEKMPVIAALEDGKPSSPWAKERDSAGVGPDNLPSSLGPRAAAPHADDVPGSETLASAHKDGRVRWTAAAVVGVFVLIGAALGMRAVTRATPDGGAGRAATGAASAAPPALSAVPSAAPSQTSVPTAPEAASASSTPAASAQPPAPTSATAHAIAHKPSGSPDLDPYDAAPPSPAPAPTVAPVAPPAPPSPAPAVTVAPVPPPPAVTAVPGPSPSQKPTAPPTPSVRPLAGPPVY
jgi:S-DNA-T family DNA segregation ATPase FtsK/SpoIIIE